MKYGSANIAALQAAINAEIIANGNEEITGPILNDILNGNIKFIIQSALNWGTASLYSSGGNISLSNAYLGVAVFMTNTPTSLSWGDNVYNEYVFINLTGGAIALGTPSAYYDLTGAPVTSIPANTALTLFKTSGSLWVQGSSDSGTGSIQREPKTYVVGTDVDAPTVGANTWTLPAFGGAYVTLWINGSKAKQKDCGDGNPFITKTSLSSTTITVGNYPPGWVAGDILDYILITP